MRAVTSSGAPAVAVPAEATLEVGAAVYPEGLTSALEPAEEDVGATALRRLEAALRTEVEEL